MYWDHVADLTDPDDMNLYVIESLNINILWCFKVRQHDWSTFDMQCLLIVCEVFFFLFFLHSSIGGVAYVTVLYSPATWAATFRLRGYKYMLAIFVFP